MEEKICTKCNSALTVADFHKDKHSSDGLKRWCKTCSKAHQKEYAQTHRDSINATMRLWHERNKEQRNARRRERRAADPEKYRKYDKTKWERHGERINEERRDYRKTRTPEEIEQDNERQRQHYADFLERKPDYEKKRSERRKKENPEQIKQWRYHSHLREEYGMEPSEYHARLKAQNGRCAICKQPPAPKKRLAVDHCHSSETMKIRQLLCQSCNIGLGAFRDDPELLLAAMEYLARHA